MSTFRTASKSEFQATGAQSILTDRVPSLDDLDRPSFDACSFVDSIPDNRVEPLTSDEDSSPKSGLRRRRSLPRLYVPPASEREGRLYSVIECDDVEDMFPLVGKAPRKDKSKSKARKTLKTIFGNFNPRKSKSSKAASPFSGTDLSEDQDIGGMPVQDPFLDENAAVDCDMEDVSRDDLREIGETEPEDVEMASGSPKGPEGEGPQGGGGGCRSKAVVFPRTPQKRRRSSIPTTPRSSPQSAKSKRSPLRGTPCSAKSWLTTSSERSTSTVASMASARHKHMRRRARNKLASQAKSIQLLGVEAVGAVARATKVNENRLLRKTVGTLI